MRQFLLLATICIGSFSFGQNPVILDVMSDSMDWNPETNPEAREILELLKEYDSIAFQRIKEKKELEKLRTPKIQFTTKFNVADVHVIIWNDKELVVDRYVGKQRATFGPFEAGHFYDIEFSKEDYVTKKIFISTIGAMDTLDLVTLNVSTPMVLRKNFKSFNHFQSWKKDNPFIKPVARAFPDLKGYMQFDGEYTRKRQEIISEYYRKKYQPVKLIRD